MVGTTTIHLNFCWLWPHLQFPVVVHELQCATDGSQLVFRLLPTSHLRKETHSTISRTLLRGLIFIIAWMFIAKRLCLIVRYTNFLEYLTFSPWNCACCRFLLLLWNHSVKLTTTAPAPCPHYSCSLPPSFMGLTAVKDFFTQLEAVFMLSNWVTLTPDARPLFLCQIHRCCSYFLQILTTAQEGS